MNIDKILQNIKNKDEILGKILVLQNNQILHIVKTYKEAFTIAKNRDDLHLYSVPNKMNTMRILPLKIKSLKKHPWTPLYPIDFFTNTNKITQDCLIDSGADISAINYKFGLELGLKKDIHDYIFKVEGLGGSVDYILKSIDIAINNKQLQIPIAWLQNSPTNDIIIGRETIFDIFNIEFKQNSEEIIFSEVNKEKI